MNPRVNSARRTWDKELHNQRYKSQSKVKISQRPPSLVPSSFVATAPQHAGTTLLVESKNVMNPNDELTGIYADTVESRRSTRTPCRVRYTPRAAAVPTPRSERSNPQIGACGSG